MYSDHRNVAGELLAVRLVIDAALERNIKEIEIFYDYQGIGSWADGKWKANNECTSHYTEYIRKVRERMDVTFTKVKAHTGDKYNEMADDLAKDAVGLLESPSPDKEYKPLCESAADEAVARGTTAACIRNIREFYQNKKHTFSDYLMLRAGRDAISIREHERLEDGVAEAVLSYIKGSGLSEDETVDVLRWYHRGLLSKDAVKKVQVDKEIREKKARRQQ